VTDGILPKDAWDRDFHYQTPGNEGREYDIYSYGNDNAPGGEGNNADIYPWSQD
jgi:general secretion pathway protein G